MTTSYFYYVFALNGCLFISECPLQQCCGVTMVVFFSKMKAQLLLVDASFTVFIHCYTYKLKDRVFLLY